MRSKCLVRACTRTLLAQAHSILLRRSSSSTSAGPAASAIGDGGGVAVKKVTRSNFDPALEDLRDRVREADFVAVDLEMTGITSAPWREAFEFDRSDVRYLKLKDSAEKFAVVQAGVCPFRWDAPTNSFVAHPHNFYIFPRNELPIDGHSNEFLWQTTSIDFLAKYQFDFNTCIHEGISYLSRAQENEAFQKLVFAVEKGLTMPSHTFDDAEIPIISTADLLFTERMKNQFTEWFKQISSNSSKGCHSEDNLTCSKIHFQTVFYKMRPAVMLDGFSSHQIKLIQLVLRKHFKDLIYVRTIAEDGTSQKRAVYADTKEDKASLMREVQKDTLRSTKSRINSAVGFRHVIDLLASENKLLVGHNCFLDVAHVYNKFVAPLPSSMVEFTLGVHKIFPHIVDTKYLMNNNPAIQLLMKKKSKSLSSVFSLLCPTMSSASQSLAINSYVKVEVQTDEDGASCSNSGAKHEAGYDAYMTGCVFAQLCSHLGIKFELLSSSDNLASNDKLKAYINLLYPSWNSGTIVDLNTGSEKPETSYKRKYPTVIYSNVLLVWGFPSMLKPMDLKECLCKVFGPDSISSIFFIDPTSALIQFTKQELVNDFLVLKDTLERNDDLISVLHPLSVLLEGGKTRAAGYDTYQDICSSSISKVLFADQAEAVAASWKAGGSKCWENQDASSCSEGTAEETPTQSVKLVRGRNLNSTRHSDHQISCEDILNSLCASKQQYGRQTQNS